MKKVDLKIIKYLYKIYQINISNHNIIKCERNNSCNNNKQWNILEWNKSM